MMTKYGFEFTNEVVNTNHKRLTNQIWKLIPMRENQEEWQEQLSTIIEEVAGLNVVFSKQINYLILLSKLEGLNTSICDDFMIYRKTVFRCIDLLAKVLDYAD